MSAGAKALAWVGIVSLAAFLSSSLLAIWLHDSPAQKNFLDVIKILLSWPVIAGGLAGAGAKKFGEQIARRLSGEAKAHDQWRDGMRFTLSHRRATMGNDLSVLVAGEGDELLSRVRVEYDGFGLSDETFAPGVTQYEKQYSQVGTAAPREPHRLIVTATSDLEKQRTAIHSWEDST